MDTKSQGKKTLHTKSTPAGIATCSTHV